MKIAVATPPMATAGPTFPPHSAQPHMTRTLGAATAIAAALVTSLSSSLPAQRVPQSASATFDHGVVVGGEWLQANALPLNRSAAGSMSFDAALRHSRWAVDAGWVRIARDLSTVQGGFVSFGVPLAWKRLLFIPSVSGFGGQAQRSVDSTGYDWIAPGGLTGHVPRFSFSQSGSVGGGAGLALEVPVFRMIAVRASASEWYFSGAPLEGDRARTLIGVGGSIRVNPWGSR